MLEVGRRGEYLGLVEKEMDFQDAFKANHSAVRV